uniref:C2H2-type domain-containing protein n=2 Tax=Hucho hucho TaxID=62062 RepID=A0A4W5RZ05_9TELE
MQQQRVSFVCGHHYFLLDETKLAEYPTLIRLEMSKLQLFRVFLNERLSAAAVEIFGAVEKTVVEYQEENDRLRRLLGRTPEIPLCRIDSLQLSVSEEEVPPEQQHCEQEWSPSLGQEDPETTQIKEEQEEVRTSQEEEQLQGLFDTKDSIFTPSCVKSECDEEDPHQEAILAEYPTLSPLKMSKLQFFRVFLNERFTASAAVEIFGEVEQTLAEYQEENDRLWRLLRITPDIKLCRIDSLQLSEEEVPPEQQQCEQEWSHSLGQEDPETTQIKEEQEEARTSQEEEQIQGLFDTKDSIFTPSCVKSECDQADPFQSFTRPQTQTVENRESDSKPVDLKPFGTVTHIKGLYIPCDPPDNQNNASSHSSAVSSDQVGLDSSSPLDPSPTLEKHLTKPSITSRKTYHCGDCGATFPLKADLKRHVTLTKKRPSECRFCKQHYNSTCKLKAHVRLCHSGKPCTCPVCGKIFKHKGVLSRHMRIHTGEKPFSCGDCGKSFNQKVRLTEHKLTHTGENPFSCGDCGTKFNRKGHLNMHKMIHTGEKPFSCGDCGKKFNRKGHLSVHKLIHTGEKPFSCGDCGKGFNRMADVRRHKLTHTGERTFICGDCGKSFNQKGSLTLHKLTHTGERTFICGDCGKSFYLKGSLTLHKLTHTGEKPFSCGDCAKSFYLKGSLTRHKLTHTGEKPFSCDDCGKSFNQKGDLRRHILTHTGDKQHGCSVCGKRFSQKTNLLRHVDKVHKGRKQDRN